MGDEFAMAKRATMNDLNVARQQGVCAMIVVGFTRQLPHIKGFINATYLAMASMLTAQSQFECHTVYARIMNLGFCLFILAFITSFTGTVAVGMIQEAQGHLQSVEDAIAMGKTVCIMPAAHKLITSKYPKLVVKIAPSFEDQLSYMETNACSAALMPKANFDHIQFQGKHCDKVATEKIMFQAPSSMPVSTKHAPILSWMISDAISKGWYEEARRDAIESYPPLGTSCESKGENESQITQMTIKVRYTLLLLVTCR
jgi:hypothetical protein